MRELRIQESFEEDREQREDLVLLMTDLEVRVVSPVEAQELGRTKGEALQTLTIPPQTDGTPEIHLTSRPLLVLFREKVTVREAYKQLHSLLGSSRPVPKPRAGSGHSNSSPVGVKMYLPPGQRDTLAEALRRGIETGDRTLTLQTNTGTETTPEPRQSSVDTMESNGSEGSEDSPARASQNPRQRGEDICSSTYRRLDSLEETIRELENTLIEISGHPSTEHLYSQKTSQNTPAQIQTTGTTASDIKKPPVPPKPSSFSLASIQVYFLTPPSVESHSQRACGLAPYSTSSLSD